MEGQARKETQSKKLREDQKKREQERVLLEKRRKIEFPDGGTPRSPGANRNKKKEIRDRFFSVMQRNPHLFKANLIDQKITILKTQGYFQTPYPLPDPQHKLHSVQSNPALKVAPPHTVQPDGRQHPRRPAAAPRTQLQPDFQVHPV